MLDEYTHFTLEVEIFVQKFAPQKYSNSIILFIKLKF